MRKIIVLLLVSLGLLACSSEPESQEKPRPREESQFVEESLESQDLESEQFAVENTEKQSLHDIESETGVNPEPNDKPEPEASEVEDQGQAPPVQKITVSPDKVGQEGQDSESDDEDLPEDFIVQPAYEISDPSYSPPLVDIYLLGEEDELYEVEQDLGVNITVRNFDDAGQRILIVPRYPYGLLRVDQISYDPDLGGYHVGDSLYEVYMSDDDAILLQTSLSTEAPNILLSYYDEAGSYKVQSLLDYGGQGLISLNNGYRFVN